MTTEYIASQGTRYNLTKYILSNGVEVILNEEELEELFNGLPKVVNLERELLKVTTQRDTYKSLIKDYNDIISEMSKIK